MSLTEHLDSHVRVHGDKDCPDCKGHGLVPPTARRTVYICPCIAKSEKVEHLCQMLAAYIGRKHPDWIHKMEVAMDEHRWTFTQLIGACVAYVYERGLYMSIPADPLFEEGAPETPADQQCALPGCGKHFTPKYPGDKFCCMEHGQLALPKAKVKQPLPVVDQPAVDAMTAAYVQGEGDSLTAPLPLHTGHDEFADG